MAIIISKPELARLLRGNPGWDADSLAEELFCLLPQLIRETPAKRLIANVDDNSEPPIVINDFGDGNSPIISIRRGDEIVNITIEDFGSPPQPQEPATASSFPGEVVGYSGGNVYSVEIYPEGLSGPSQIVDVRQLEGDPDFPHADGRWATVSLNGEEYTMQIPVWG